MSEYYKVQHDLEFREFDTYEEALKFYQQRVEDAQFCYYEEFDETNRNDYQSFEYYLDCINLKIYKITDVTPR